jgi:hypothetical protein
MLGYCLLQALYFGNARVLSPGLGLGLGFRVYQCWVIFFHCGKEHLVPVMQKKSGPMLVLLISLVASLILVHRHGELDQVTPFIHWPNTGPNMPTSAGFGFQVIL